MRRLLLVTALIALSCPALAAAETLRLPKDAPAFSVQAPDAWRADEIGTGYALLSPDRQTMVELKFIISDMAEKWIVADTQQMIQNLGMKLDAFSKKTTKIAFADRTWRRSTWTGKDRTGKPFVLATLFTTIGNDKEKTLSLTYWILGQDRETIPEPISRILASIKPIAG